MKVTYIVAVFIYLLFFIRIYKYRRSVNISLELLLFSLIAAPGIEISKNIIHFSDLIIPCIFFTTGILNNKKLRFTAIEKLYFLYSIAIILSIIFNISYYDVLMKACLQAVRVLWIILSIIIFHNNYKVENKGQLINSINVYGIWLCIITIVSFLEQDTIYASTQYMWLGSLTLHRAGGIYGESSYLGCFTVALLISGLYQTKSVNKHYQLNALVVSILSIICNIISYTRSSNYAMIMVIIILFFYKLTRKKLNMLIGFIFMAAIGIAFVPFLRSFVFDRMLSVFDSSDGINKITSGRLDVWNVAVSKYVDHGNWLFGVGYKNGFFSDNNFLMSLVQMGILGLVINIMLMIILFMEAIKYKNVYKFASAIALLMMSMSCDCLTYYKAISIYLILYNMTTRSYFNIQKSKKLVQINAGKVDPVSG